MTTRSLSPLDRLIGQIDTALRQVAGVYAPPSRPTPAAEFPGNLLSAAERDLSGRLMRINHTGEICAQALYQGQALTARTGTVQEKLETAAAEENDHLTWCAERLSALGARPSYLNSFWYLGSLTLGALAGVAGDKWNLGFLAETERQVVAHLDRHLTRLPPVDAASRAVLQQMRTDETAHATTALEAGGASLPTPVRFVMRAASQIMTTTTYWI